jgi:putative tryptophan/tyrosine transport system substrate-binding protein
LKNTGFIEGKNVSIEWRWAEGRYDRLSSLAGELVGRNVAVIVALEVPSAFAAKAATRTTPIVFGTGADPVKLGLVESLNHPGGNLTGVSTFLTSLGPKQLEILHELLPNASNIALLANPRNPNWRTETSEIQAAADALAQHLEVLTASTEIELDTTRPWSDNGSMRLREAGPVFPRSARTTSSAGRPSLDAYDLSTPNVC